jgi:hypothetical protein
MTDLFFALVVFAVSFAIGDRLIRRVPPMLHAPLMHLLPHLCHSERQRGICSRE